jgi:NAD-dependent SIR2 family protein deacetylase
MTNNYYQAAQAIQEADAIIILAGAGMGVDSGLPDFRGKEGFWKAYPMLKNHRMAFSDIANPEAFLKRPTLAWGFYGHRLNLYRNTVPHEGFAILKDIAESKPDGYFIYTSNVDGQFQKAGFDANRIVECHGSIHHLQYLEPDAWEEPISADTYQVEVEMDTLRASYESLPTARNGDLLRPNIMMFNDWHWLDSRANAQQERHNKWIESIKGKKVVAIEIGAGDAIATIRYQSQLLRRKYAQTLIQINPNPGKYADIVISDGAFSALSQIQRLVNS